MAVKRFSTEEALRFGWETYRNNFGFFVGLLVVLIFVALLPGMLIAKITVFGGLILGIPLHFLNFIWRMLLGVGLLRICLKFLDAQTPELADLFSGIDLVLNYAIEKILYALIALAGLILLVVPLFIWAVQFSLGGYLIVDKRLGPIEALKRSSAITTGTKWDLGIFLGFLVLINLLGACVFLIGLMVSLPITMLAGVHVYRQLLAHPAVA
jgi:uncharacterized membrane protein